MNQSVYETPKSKLIAKGLVVVGLKHRSWATFLVIIAIAFYSSIYVTVPQFADVFTQFGSGLPVMTVLFVWLSPVCIWFAIASLAPLLIWVGGFIGNSFSLFMYKLSKYNLAVSFMFFVSSMVSLYLPIFAVG
ncbi:hypothetical protein [Cellvibrio sp. UBA7671]|uniref:hypothetical protein n=1 Tax=Cellvibrio sp. UBA7671 TaxID=1946312 RepID=UPI002F34F1C5